MSDEQEHLDKALAEEFEGKAETIHALKLKSAHFRNLLDRNHDLWKQIQHIQSGEAPAADDTLEGLEKKRLKILDHIAAAIAEHEAK